MLQLAPLNLQKDKIGTLVIPVCEDKAIHTNPKLTALIKKAKQIKGFKGEKDDEVILYDLPDTNVSTMIFKGLGKLEDLEAESLRAMAGKMVGQGIKKDLPEIGFAVPSAKKIGKGTSDILEAMLEGGFLGNHVFDKYKKEKKHKPVKEIHFFATADVVKRFQNLPDRVATVCEGTLLAREWVTTPSNDKLPVQLAKSIVATAEKAGLKATVLDEKELKKLKCGSMLAVGAGSQNKPCMVLLEYRPKGAKKTVAFVGKGITFDSGGINLKPGGSSRDMKCDMSGAAAVAGALTAIAKLKPKVNVIGAMPLVENMPSGSSYRPGDILKSHDGKTVEVGNTDAEGRLILIDAISYVIKTYKPDTLIDLATLTGACVVALGEKIAGVFSWDDELAQAIVESGDKTHERCWHLPLPKDYKKALKSEIADLSNTSSDLSGGGAITAALFLSEFVEDTKWAHIDIAGPAHFMKGSDYCGAGGTGFGVRLLCDLLEKL